LASGTPCLGWGRNSNDGVKRALDDAAGARERFFTRFTDIEHDRAYVSRMKQLNVLYGNFRAGRTK
jgi:hypothetical protein